MPAFSFHQDEQFANLVGRNRVKIRGGHPLNNPNRPEFMSDGATARALFQHVYQTLTSDEPGVALNYWNELKSMVARATRNPTEEKQISTRRGGEVNIALASTEDLLTDAQLTGGTMVAMARRDLYANTPDSISRNEKHRVVQHLTARALGEVVNSDADLRRPSGALGRIAENLSETPAYANLKAGISQIYANTRPDPISEMDHDLDAMEEADRNAVLEVNEKTRVTKTEGVIKSFADSFLTDALDQSETRAKGEDSLKNTIFVMETAQEAAVLEAVAGWAQKVSRDNNGQLPSKEEVAAGFGKNGLFGELSKVTMTAVEQRTPYSNNGLVRRLTESNSAKWFAKKLFPEAFPEDPAQKATKTSFTNDDVAKLLGELRKSKDPSVHKVMRELQADTRAEATHPWVHVEKTEVMQRKPIFGKGSNQFDHWDATGIAKQKFYKNVDLIAAAVKEIHDDNKDRNYKGAALMPNDGSDAVQAAVKMAEKIGMPVVNLNVTYTRQSVNEAGKDEKTTVKDLRYTIEVPEKDKATGAVGTREVEVFSREGYRATNGALILLNAKGMSDRQSQIVQWDAMADIPNRNIVFGAGKQRNGREDYESAQIIVKSAAQGKLAAVFDEKGEAVDRKAAVEAARPAAKSKKEMALDAFNAAMSPEERNAKLDSVYAQLLVHHMHTALPKERLDTVKKVDGTVADLLKLPSVAADGGKSLEAGEREKFLTLAKAIGAQTFALDTVAKIEKVAKASELAAADVTMLREKGCGLAFDGPGTKHGPLVTVGQGRLDDADTRVMVVGGTRQPTPEQREAIEETVARIGRQGAGVVTTLQEGTNAVVMEAAVKHNVPLVVVAPNNPALGRPLSPEMSDRLYDVVTSQNGLVVGPFNSAPIEVRKLESGEKMSDAEYERATKARKQWEEFQLKNEGADRAAYGLASEISKAAVLAKASDKDFAAFAVAQVGQTKPVAALPTFEVQDRGNQLLTQDFSAISMKVGKHGTQMSSSFYTAQDPELGWTTVREKDPIVVGGHDATRIVQWHDAAYHAGPKETLDQFVDRFVQDVTLDNAKAMIRPDIRTERDLAIAMGLEQAPIHGSQITMPENELPADEKRQLVESKLAQFYESETVRVTRGNDKAPSRNREQMADSLSM